MSVPVKFSDIGKSVSDLLNKDIPVNTVKVEANTQTASGVVRVSCLPVLVVLVKPLTRARTKGRPCPTPTEVHRVWKPRQRERQHER